MRQFKNEILWLLRNVLYRLMMIIVSIATFGFTLTYSSIGRGDIDIGRYFG